MSNPIKVLAIVIAVVAVLEAFYIVLLSYETKLAVQRAILIEESLRLSEEAKHKTEELDELHARLCRAYRRTLARLVDQLDIARPGSAAETLLSAIGGPGE
jgi:hypothetical protein